MGRSVLQKTNRLFHPGGRVPFSCKLYPLPYNNSYHDTAPSSSTKLLTTTTP